MKILTSEILWNGLVAYMVLGWMQAGHSGKIPFKNEVDNAKKTILGIDVDK